MDIRIVTPADSASVAEIYAPIVRDSFISFEREPPDAQEIAERIEKTLISHPWLVAEEGEAVLGYAYANQHRTRHAYQWSCDVSVYVREKAQRRGIGRRLYERLFTLLKQQGFGKAYAGIALPNPGSVHLHESVGFEPVGIYRGVGFKKGSWRDVGWWARPIQDLGVEPASPILFRNCPKA